MDSENHEISRHIIHRMFSVIKRSEIENAKTMKFSDKEMVTKVSNYILNEAKKQVHAEENEDKGEEDSAE